MRRIFSDISIGIYEVIGGKSKALLGLDRTRLGLILLAMELRGDLSIHSAC